MTQPLVQPYLFFGGRCQEALEFYQSALGAEIEMLMRFRESPDPVPEGMLAPGFEDKVMHAAFRIGGSTLMASDGCGGQVKIEGVSLSLAALAEGGEVTMPLDKTFWSPRFGMVTDRFGVGWMINVVA